MKPFYLKYSFALFLSVMTMGLVYAVFGLYFEDSEKFAAAILYGNIASPPAQGWFMDNWLFHVPIIVFLSNFFQSIPVLGIWQLIVHLLFLSLWFHLVIRMFSRVISRPFFLLVTSYLLVIAVVGTSLIYFYNLRDAILLTSVSLLAYLDYYLQDDKKSTPLVFLFLLGCLMRVTGGILVLFAISFLFLLHFHDFKKIVHLLKWHWLLAIACFVLVKGYHLIENNPGMKIEQGYEYALQDRGAILPLAVMKTAEDTMRYRAVTEYFLVSDSAQINVNFIARVVDNSKYLSFGITRDDFAHLLKKSFPIVKNNAPVIFLFYLLLFIAGYNSKGETIFTVIFFNLFCWLIILVIGMKLAIYNYFLAPWLTLAFGCSLYFLSMHKSFNFGQKTGAFMVLVMLLGYETKSDIEISFQEKEYNKMAFTYLRKINSLSQDSIPVLWDFEQLYLPTELFSRKEAGVLKNCIFQNTFFLAYYRFGQERCLQKFGFSPLDWKNMNLSFHKHSDKICFVMTDNFANFLEKYYNALYHLDFKLIKENPDEIYPGTFVYHLSKK
jgi:hypothetical protein